MNVNAVIVRDLRCDVFGVNSIKMASGAGAIEELSCPVDGSVVIGFRHCLHSCIFLCRLLSIIPTSSSSTRSQEFSAAFWEVHLCECVSAWL